MTPLSGFMRVSVLAARQKPIGKLFTSFQRLCAC